MSGLTFEPSVFTLAPNGSQTVTVTFPSSTAGEFSGLINILSNDLERAKHHIILFCESFRQHLCLCWLFKRSAINFGTVEVAQMVQQTDHDYEYRYCAFGDYRY